MMVVPPYRFEDFAELAQDLEDWVPTYCENVVHCLRSEIIRINPVERIE